MYLWPCGFVKYFVSNRLEQNKQKSPDTDCLLGGFFFCSIAIIHLNELKFCQTNVVYAFGRDHQENKNCDGLLAPLLQGVHRQINASRVCNISMLFISIDSRKNNMLGLRCYIRVFRSCLV